MVILQKKSHRLLFFKTGIFAKLLNTICIFGCFQPGFEFFFISSGLDTVTYKQSFDL